MKHQMHEKVIEALIEQGGTKADLRFFDKKMAWNTAEEIIRLSKKTQDHFINGVTPVNNIQDSLVKFDRYSRWLEKEKIEFRMECKDISISKDILLIKCKPAYFEATIKEIDDRGFVSVPSPYLLGLGVNHYDSIKKDYGCIISLDVENIIRDESDNKSFLYLNLCGERKLLLAKYNGKFSDDWWFAVTRRDMFGYEAKKFS